MTERRKYALKFGAEVSLLYEDETVFLSCPGGAHPKLALRPGTLLVDLLSFENCVFVVHPPIDGGGGGRDAHNNIGAASSIVEPGRSSAVSAAVRQYVLQTDVTYGARFLLKHKQSGLFVSILSTQPSEMDSDCHMVALIAESEAAQTRSAMFRFTPRFKVHNEGDFVCQGDSVLIQSVSHKLFLHVSELATVVGSEQPLPPLRYGSSMGHSAARGGVGPLNSPPQGPRVASAKPDSIALNARLEVNGSESLSPWVVQRYDYGLEHIDCQKVAAKGKPLVLLGTPVALFHRERESLLTSSAARPLGTSPSTSSGKGGRVDSGAVMSPRTPTSLRSTAFASTAINRTSAATLETRRRGYQSMSSMADSTPTAGSGVLSRVGSMAPPALSLDLTAEDSTSAAAASSVDMRTGPARGASDAQIEKTAGVVFPLLSPYTNGYLSNEFSFATLRCSCAAYWVFEQVDPTIGGPLRFGAPFRLRQAATNMYLAVVGNDMDRMMSAQWQPFVSGIGRGSSALSSGTGARNNMAPPYLRSPMSGASLSFGQRGGGGQDAKDGTIEFTLALVPAPADEDMQQRTLFIVEHTFYPEARVVSETDFFRIQNVETGLWLCSDGDMSLRSEVTLSLQFRPLAHDAFMTGHISEQAHRDVLHIFYNFDALQRYKNLFATWWQSRTSSSSSSRSSAQRHLMLEKSAAEIVVDSTEGKDAASAKDDRSSLTHSSSSSRFGKSTETSCASIWRESSAAAPPDEPDPPTSAGSHEPFNTRKHTAVIRRCAEALTSLIHFCTASDDPDPLTREGLPISDHQRMMFDLQLHRMVFDIIVAPLVPVTDPPKQHTTIDLGQSAHKLPRLPLQGGAVPRKQFDTKHSEYGVLHNISRLGFRLIKQMVMGNPTFAALLAKYIPMMFELDGMKLHVVEVMHEIFTENDELPPATVGAAVDHYVKTLVLKQRSAGYLKFLATMCALRNHTCGLVENQELVCRKLIHEIPREKPVLLPTVLLESGHVGVLYAVDEEPSSIEVFLTSHKDAKLVKFFEGQIELFAKLSCGCGSTFCAKTLEELFPSLQLDGVVKTILWTGEEVAGKPSKLDLTRCNLFRLAMNVYVHPVLRNSETQLALNTILIGSSRLRLKWSLRRKDSTFPHSAVKDSVLMTSIKHAAMQLLQANPFILITDRPRNELLKTVVDVWRDFIAYRQYSTEELRTLLPLVVRLLDGTRDVASVSALAALRTQQNGGGTGPASIPRQGSSQHLHRSASSRFGSTADTHRPTHQHSSTDERRFLKTEDSFLVMEIRLSICGLLSLILRNMIHDEADEIIVQLFGALGGINACGGSGRASETDHGANLAQAPPRPDRSFPKLFRRVASVFGLAKDVVDDVLEKSDSGPQKGGDHHHLASLSLDSAPSVTDSLIDGKVQLISACFNPEELVPIILDTAQYNHPQLTTESMNLLVDLCSIRRKLCENVLSVKLVPSREMLSQFDRLHGVAVEIATAVQSDDVEETVDAMEMVLKTLLQNYIPKNRLRQIGSTLGAMHTSFGSMRSTSPTVREGSTDSTKIAESSESVPRGASAARRRAVKFTDGSDEDAANDSAASPPAAKPPRTAKSRWAEATTVAKLVAISKRVQRKRNSLGLDPSSDVPLDVICRAELMCHWGIHLTLLDRIASGKILPSHPAYVDVLDFFYYFALSPSNARQLSPYLELFIAAINNEDVRMQCMHVVVAVLSARALRPVSQIAAAGGGSSGEDTTGGADGKTVDLNVLQSLAAMIAQEHQSREPDSSFLRLVNKHLLGDTSGSRGGVSGEGSGESGAPAAVVSSALSQTSSKQFVHLLHARSVFQHLSEPRTSRAAELQFNSSLVDLLCGICRSNRSVRSLAQRIVPQQQLLELLNRRSRSDVLPKLHQCPYYRLLAEVFFSRDEESESERVKIMTVWNECSLWWSLVKMLGRQYNEVAGLQRKAVTDGNRLRDTGSSADEILSQQSDEQRDTGATKEFWFHAVPSACTAFFVTTFSITCLGTHRSEVCDALKELAAGLASFSAELSSSAGVFHSLHVGDVVALARCMHALEDTLEALDDGYSIIDRLRIQRRFQLQELVEELRAISPSGSSQSLRRLDSSAPPSSSQYGNGSFFFQSDVRDMTELEIAVRKVLVKSAPRDIVLSRTLLKSSHAAQCLVRYFTAMASPLSSENVARDTPLFATAASQKESVLDEHKRVGVLAPSQRGLVVTRKTMEAFVLKLLGHMASLALPAETISCILNIIHATLVGIELPLRECVAATLHGRTNDGEELLRHHSTAKRKASLGGSDDFAEHLEPHANVENDVAPGTANDVVDLTAVEITSDVINAELEHRRLVARQNHFDHLGLMRVVTGLSDLSDPTVTKSALEVGIALLEGGNTQVQNNMLQYFETHDESFFHNVKEILQSCMERVQAYNEWLLQRLLERGSTHPGLHGLHSSGSGGRGDQAEDGQPRSLTNRQRSMLSLTALLAASRDAGVAPGSANRSPGAPGNADGGSPTAVPLRYPGANPFLYIAETFRFLQLMCEGHHHGMQNYIRVQSDNLHSINVLQEVLMLIVELTAVRVDNFNAAVLRKGLELLTEFCQGPCVENQATLLQNDICSLLAMVFQLQAAAGSPVAGAAPIDQDRLTELQHAASVTLLALTEGSSRPEVFQKVLSQIPLGAIERLVKAIATSANPSSHNNVQLPLAAQVKPDAATAASDDVELSSSHSSSSSDASSEDADAGEHAVGDDDADGPKEELLFNLLIYTKAVTPFLERAHDHVALECARRVFGYVPHIAKRLGSIQVERDGVVERVYFPIPEICLSLTQKSKDDVLWSVDRTSRLTKLNDFFQKIDELMFEMNSVHRFARRVDGWMKCATRIHSGGDAPTEPTCAGGQLFCSSSKTRKGYNDLSALDKLRVFWNGSVSTYICRSDPEYYENIALVLSVVINVLFVCTNGVDREASSTTLTEWLVGLLCGFQLLLYIMVFCMDTVVFLPVYFYRGYRRQLRAAGIVVSTQQVSLEDVLRSMPSYRRRLISAMHRFTTTYYLSLIAASLCALFIDPYFAAIHLLGLINKSASLRTVIVAITQNGKSLLLTMGLGVIVVYMFSIVGYVFFPGAFGGAEEGAFALSENCETLGRCFMFILTSGLRQGGGVGDLMDKAPWDSSMLVHRMGYDFAFYALVNVVFLNILFGIIIDTFAELRDDKRRKEEDMNTCCFICGLDAEVFEKEGGGFKRHVHRDHNMWQYLYFIYYLRLKDPNDFNGQESFVHREMVRGSLGFLPDGQCLSLAKYDDGGLPEGDERRNQVDDDDSHPSMGPSTESNAKRPAAGSDPSNSAAALAGSVASAVRSDLDALRDQLSSALREMSTEVTELRNSSTATSGGLVPDLMVSATAPAFGATGTGEFFVPQHLRAAAATAAAGRARRRSKSVSGHGSLDATAAQDHLELTIDGDSAVTSLHAQIAALDGALRLERERCNDLQRRLFESCNALTAANDEREELANEMQRMLDRTLGSTTTPAAPQEENSALDALSVSATTATSADSRAAPAVRTVDTRELVRSLSASVEKLLQHKYIAERTSAHPAAPAGSGAPSSQVENERRERLLLQLENIPLDATTRTSPPTPTLSDRSPKHSGNDLSSFPKNPPLKTVSFRLEDHLLTRVPSMVSVSTYAGTVCQMEDRSAQTDDMPELRQNNRSSLPDESGSWPPEVSGSCTPLATPTNLGEDAVQAKESAMPTPPRHLTEMRSAATQVDDGEKNDLSTKHLVLRLEHRRLQELADKYLRDCKTYAECTEVFLRERRAARDREARLRELIAQHEEEKNQYAMQKMFELVDVLRERGVIPDV